MPACPSVDNRALTATMLFGSSEASVTDATAVSPFKAADSVATTSDFLMLHSIARERKTLVSSFEMDDRYTGPSAPRNGSHPANVTQDSNTPAGNAGRSRHSQPLQIEILLSGGVWMWAEDDRKEIAV